MFYRGTQRETPRGNLGSASFTESLPVAIIWSARPGDVWSSRKEARVPSFTEGSTVHAVELNFRNLLTLGDEYDSYTNLGTILEQLGYGTDSGMSIDEATDLINYLHRRLVGKVRGAGEFNYRVWDEEGEEVGDDQVPFTLTSPETMISWLFYPDFEYDPSIRIATHLVADTYAFADAPIVQKVARRLGYDGFAYRDVFQGGISAAEDLLDTNVYDIPEVEQGSDMDDWGEEIPVVWTWRPLEAGVIQPVWSEPSEEVLEFWSRGGTLDGFAAFTR